MILSFASLCAVCDSIPAPRRLQTLLSEVDGSFRLDDEAAEVVLHLVEDFMNSVATHAAQLARHR